MIAHVQTVDSLANMLNLVCFHEDHVLETFKIAGRDDCERLVHFREVNVLVQDGHNCDALHSFLHVYLPELGIAHRRHVLTKGVVVRVTIRHRVVIHVILGKQRNFVVKILISVASALFFKLSGFIFGLFFERIPLNAGENTSRIIFSLKFFFAIPLLVMILASEARALIIFTFRVIVAFIGLNLDKSSELLFDALRVAHPLLAGGGLLSLRGFLLLNALRFATNLLVHFG